MTKEKKFEFLYVFLGEGADPKKHNAVIDTPKCRVYVYGVKSQEEGVELCKDLVKKGIVCIELCGAWGYEGASKVAQAVGDKVPVGSVTHQVRNAPKLVEKFYKRAK